jgi:pectate lyase
MAMVKALLTVAALLLVAGSASAQQLAFPGAEGYGRFSVGGRGGVAYLVTNTNDSGPGSLRACIEATVPRTCVFRVGGIWTSATALTVTSPFLTIAGETAPPPGVTLRINDAVDTDPLIIAADDVIVRFIAAENSPRVGSTSNTRDGLSVTTAADRIILDHVSVRFGIDETLDPSGCDMTVQNSIVAWGLENAGHAEGVHSKGLLAQNAIDGCDLSLIRVLLANSNDRMPDIERYDNVQIVNMLSYNADGDFGEFRTPDGSTMNLDVIGSECRAGPATIGTIPPCIRIAEAGGASEVYEVYIDDVIPATGSVGVLGTGDDVWQVLEDHGMPTIDTILAAGDLNDMLPLIGRTLPMRDIFDLTVTENAIEAGTNDSIARGGKIIDAVPVSVPTVEAGLVISSLAASCPCDWRVVDTDGDGMPNYYEAINGFNPYSATDGAEEAVSGYTNLEEYLHQMAARTPGTWPAAGSPE